MSWNEWNEMERAPSIVSTVFLHTSFIYRGETSPDPFLKAIAFLFLMFIGAKFIVFFQKFSHSARSVVLSRSGFIWICLSLSLFFFFLIFLQPCECWIFKASVLVLALSDHSHVTCLDSVPPSVKEGRVTHLFQLGLSPLCVHTASKKGVDQLGPRRPAWMWREYSWPLYSIWPLLFWSLLFITKPNPYWYTIIMLPSTILLTHCDLFHSSILHD